MSSQAVIEDENRVLQKQLSALDFISNLLTETSFDLQPLLEEIVRVSAESMQKKACTIRLLEPSTGEMLLKAAHGLSDEYLRKGPVFAGRSMFRQIVERCGEQDTVVEIYDVSADERLQYTREAVSEGIRSLLIAPLVRDGRAIGALTVFSAHPHHFTEEERRLFQTIANQASVAISLAQLYQEKLELHRIEHELTIAADLQRQLMPKKPPYLEGFELAGRCLPCHEIGGDFFDFIELPQNNLGIAVGDVAGKGIPAALLMATIRTALRVQAENIYTMYDVVARVNRAVHADTRPEEFVTLFYGVIDGDSRKLTYVNAGHATTVLIRNGELVRLEPSGPPLGILPHLVAKEDVIELEPGDLLIVFTDGYTDAPDESGEVFGDERFLGLLEEFRSLDPAEIVARVETAVETFVSESPEYCDDRTIVVLKCLDET